MPPRAAGAAPVRVNGAARLAEALSKLQEGPSAEWEKVGAMHAHTLNVCPQPYRQLQLPRAAPPPHTSA